MSFYLLSTTQPSSVCPEVTSRFKVTWPEAAGSDLNSGIFLRLHGSCSSTVDTSEEGTRVVAPACGPEGQMETFLKTSCYSPFDQLGQRG